VAGGGGDRLGRLLAARALSRGSHATNGGDALTGHRRAAIRAGGERGGLILALLSWLPPRSALASMPAPPSLYRWSLRHYHGAPLASRPENENDPRRSCTGANAVRRCRGWRVGSRTRSLARQGAAQLEQRSVSRRRGEEGVGDSAWALGSTLSFE
jgi:hypothetical protein